MTRISKKRMPATGTEASVCDDIARRQSLGRLKYGFTVAENPLTLKQWLQHAYEECLDQAIYLKRAIAEIESVESVKSLVKKYENHHRH